LRAKKDNKVYDIDQSQANRYMKQGFDIFNDDGSLYSYSDLKTIKYSDHLKEVNELKEKLDEAQKENASLKKKLESASQGETTGKGK
jgi:hypothetical protein